MTALEIEVLLDGGLRTLTSKSSAPPGKPFSRLRCNGLLMSVEDAVTLIGLLNTAVELVKHDEAKKK